jgi:hypothetical protein
MDEIKRQVRAWSRWARLQQGIGLSFVGLSCGLALALILALAARLAPLLDRPTLIGLSAALAVAGLLAALLLPWVLLQPVRFFKRFSTVSLHSMLRLIESRSANDYRYVCYSVCFVRCRSTWQCRA